MGKYVRKPETTLCWQEYINSFNKAFLIHSLFFVEFMHLVTLFVNLTS